MGKVNLSKEAIPDFDQRMDAVKAAFRAEMESRGYVFARDNYLGGFMDDGFEVGVGFSIRRQGGGYTYRSTKNRMTITLGAGYTSSVRARAYAEPVKGYDISKMADRMVECIDIVRNNDAVARERRSARGGSSSLLEIFAKDFPKLKWQASVVDQPDKIKIHEQTLTLDQARQIAVLLVKFQEG